MYMKNAMYKILVGCYIVAALVLVTACNDGLDIQQAYPFTVETLPVPVWTFSRLTRSRWKRCPYPRN